MCYKVYYSTPSVYDLPGGGRGRQRGGIIEINSKRALSVTQIARRLAAKVVGARLLSVTRKVT